MHPIVEFARGEGKYKPVPRIVPLYSSTDATMHSATALSAGLLFAAAAHGFAPTPQVAPTPAAQRYGDGRVGVLRSSCRSVVPLRIAPPAREGSRTNLNRGEDEMGPDVPAAACKTDEPASARAEKMFTSFDAFRKQATKEASHAEQAFSRFDEFLKSDGRKKN